MHEGLRFDLERFVTAQAPVIEQALDELRQGRKRSHWMWFIFPQIAGLTNGNSESQTVCIDLWVARTRFARYAGSLAGHDKF
jgi:uncharacterized protein (DUF1810 family)